MGHLNTLATDKLVTYPQIELQIFSITYNLEMIVRCLSSPAVFCSSLQELEM